MHRVTNAPPILGFSQHAQGGSYSPDPGILPACTGWLIAGVQPRQDPGGTLRMNGVSERERRHVRPALIAPSLRGRERERERKRERMTRQGCLQGLAESGNALFFTIAFIP